MIIIKQRNSRPGLQTKAAVFLSLLKSVTFRVLAGAVFTGSAALYLDTFRHADVVVVVYTVLCLTECMSDRSGRVGRVRYIMFMSEINTTGVIFLLATGYFNGIK